MFKKNFAKAKTRLKFYNELVKNFSEKFFQNSLSTKDSKSYKVIYNQSKNKNVKGKYYC